MERGGKDAAEMTSERRRVSHEQTPIRTQPQHPVRSTLQQRGGRIAADTRRSAMRRRVCMKSFLCVRSLVARCVPRSLCSLGAAFPVSKRAAAILPRADLIDELSRTCMQKKMDGDDEATPPLLGWLVKLSTTSGVPAERAWEERGGQWGQLRMEGAQLHCTDDAPCLTLPFHPLLIVFSTAAAACSRSRVCGDDDAATRESAHRRQFASA